MADLRRALFGALAAVALLAPRVAEAQEPPRATLVADSIRIEGDGRLIAEGNVDVFFENNRLSASRVSYDRATDTLDIAGPLRLSDGEGNLLLASSAELDSALSDGILRSARLVLDEQLQLAADSLSRSEGRFTELQQVVASSCDVCAGETPLWEIRAASVVHDQTERQLYFENAQFRVGGVPIFYAPRLRLPDPTRDRATGFLLPEIRTTNRLATGLKFPYFITLGDSADVTLAPYVSSNTRTLETRYRQAFSNGELTFNGAYTFSDDILPDQSRGYAFTVGQLRFPNDVRLDFDLEYTTDPGYGLDYGYFDKDRLDSAVTLSRTKRDSFQRAGLILYETLRDEDIGLEDTLPRSTAEFLLTHRVPTGALGGDAWLRFDGTAIERPSNADGLGRDVTSVGVAFDWRRSWVTGTGLELTTALGVMADAYSVTDDSAFPPAPTRTATQAGLTLRWPLIRRSASGTQTFLEPVAQFIWSEVSGDAVPNEDSLVVEFDEGNLFSFSRYPGRDALETGGRANLGATWRQIRSDGWTLGATAGRVVWFDDPGQFAEGTGLDGQLSDWLLAVRASRPGQLSIINRSLLDENAEFTRNETRLDFRAGDTRVSTSYIWAVPVPEEDRDERLSEWSLDAEFRIDRNWRGSGFWRYDFVADKAAEAGLGLRYTNECVDVVLSLSRRFTTSISIEQTTDLGISVSLAGFGTGTDGVPERRACSG